MTRFKDREKALILRKQGKSYSQIKKSLGISKGTLSYWLKDYPLSEQRIRELRDWNEQRIEKCRETKRQKKENRLKEIYKIQKRLILPLNNREIFLTGLFLYWGEGTKAQPSRLSVSNSDPSMIKFFIVWMEKSLKISKTKLKIHLHLYRDMDIKKAAQFWSKTLNIPNKQFAKPYIKKSFIRNINHKGGFGHGTCNVKINDARLSEKIFMGIKAISDSYNKLN
ncbi:MAG: hypothetical protein WC475_01810 [Candidatus Paceibacterota bacterium]